MEIKFYLVWQQQHIFENGGVLMGNPYEKCPVYENEMYLLRFVEAGDAPDLLRVYSDEKAVPFFNSDNCGGDDFHYTTLERMERAIGFWQWEYEKRRYVRWTIIDKSTMQAIGTMELFNRQAKDYFNNCGLLRLDVRSDYEKTEPIAAILSLIVPNALELFDCRMLATKVPPFASERKKAVEQLGFTATEEKLVGGHDGKEYGDYYVL